MNANFTDPCDPIWANIKALLDILIGFGALVIAAFGFLANRYEKSSKNKDRPSTILPFGWASMGVLGTIAVFNFAAIFVGHHAEKKISSCSSKTLEQQNADLRKEIDDKTAQLDTQFVNHITALAKGPIDDIKMKLENTERELDRSVVESTSKIRRIVGRQSTEEPSNAIEMRSYSILLRVPGRVTLDEEDKRISPLLKTLVENEKKFCESNNNDSRVSCENSRKDLFRMKRSSAWLATVDPDANRQIVVTIEMEGQTVSFTKQRDCRNYPGCLNSVSDRHYGPDPSWDQLIRSDSDDNWKKWVAQPIIQFSSLSKDLLIKIPEASGLHGRDTNLKSARIDICSASGAVPTLAVNFSKLELIVFIDPVGTSDADPHFLHKVYPIELDAPAPRSHGDHNATTCLLMSYHPAF